MKFFKADDRERQIQEQLKSIVDYKSAKKEAQNEDGKNRGLYEESKNQNSSFSAPQEFGSIGYQ